MLKNRSFDSMLGSLYLDRPDFRGLTGDEVNLIGDTPYPVWTAAPSAEWRLSRQHETHNARSLAYPIDVVVVWTCFQ